MKEAISVKKLKSWKPVFRFLRKKLEVSATIPKNQKAIAVYNFVEDIKS